MAVQFRTLPLRAAKPLGLTAPRPVPRAQPVTPRASSALGEVLLERNLITPEQLRIAIEHQRTTNRRIGQVLIDLGFTNADAVLGALSIQLGVPATRLNGYTVNASAVQALPEKLARAWDTSIGDGSSRYSKVMSQPVIAGGRVFAMDGGVQVSALDAATGRLRVLAASHDHPDAILE